LATTVLLTDAFNEDALRANENPKAETMCAVHRRLTVADEKDPKAIDRDKKSLNGQNFAASPQDISGLLADSSALLSLGFGRFLNTMPARHFVSQNLRNLSLLGIFHRSINDKAFRRQTKSDSSKSVTQLGMESAYGTPLIASFRGAQSSVFSTRPMPTALGMRGFEAFVRGLKEGKTLAKAFEQVLCLQVSQGQRYTRPAEGDTSASPSPAPGKAPAKQEQGTADSDAVLEDLLPPHTKSAYLLIGNCWLTPDAVPEAAGGGKKK
jgi:hypothetical protein